MACDITKGRGLACKDQRTGIKHIDFFPYNPANVFTVVGQEVTVIPAGLEEVFRYKVKGAGNTFEDVPTTNLDNRTTDFDQTLNVALQRAGKDTEVQLMLLLYGTVGAAIHDNNGNVKIAGISNGLDATTAPYSSETSGYKITLVGKETGYAPVLSVSNKTAWEALVSDALVTQ